MSFLLLENRLSIDTLVVPGYFIDRFLPAASGTDVKVYLYLLRAVSTSATVLQLVTGLIFQSARYFVLLAIGNLLV